MAFTDIHSHLVPGVDDGAHDEEMSRALLRQAAAEGIRTMIVTPHNYPGRSEGSIPLVKERFRQLCLLAQEEAPEITLHLGNEVYYRDSIAEDLREERALSLAGTDYVLTEFHPGAPRQAVHAGVRRLTESGYRPVIAHVERIGSLDRDEGALRELIDMGAFLQVNTRTLTGGFFDRRSAWWRRMAAAGHIHFLGSDAHHPQQRPVVMRDAVKALEKHMTPEALARLTEGNTLDLLANRWIR